MGRRYHSILKTKATRIIRKWQAKGDIPTNIRVISLTAFDTDSLKLNDKELFDENSKIGYKT